MPEFYVSFLLLLIIIIIIFWNNQTQYNSCSWLGVEELIKIYAVVDIPLMGMSGATPMCPLSLLFKWFFSKTFFSFVNETNSLDLDKLYKI